MNTRCVIGIGCDDHGDQIAGLLVAREVRRHSAQIDGAVVAVVESSGAPEELVRAWSGVEDVIVVEAMPGERPGTIRRCRPHPRQAGFGCSSTQLSSRLREALALGSLPDRVQVVTIEATCFVRHAPVTPAVAQSSAEVSAGILRDIMAALPAGAGERAAVGAAGGDAPARRAARAAEPAPYGLAVVRGHRQQHRPRVVPADHTSAARP